MSYVSRSVSGKGLLPNHIIAGLLAVVLMTGAAFSHTKVNDPKVRAWMKNMIQTAEATKVLGEMAKGAAPFDADLANDAVRRIAEAMARVPALFEVQATDPTSEALPAIWSDWERFVDLAKTANGVAASVEIGTRDDLQAALKTIGGACSACHKEFRE